MTAPPDYTLTVVSHIINTIMAALFIGAGIYGLAWLAYQLDYLDWIDRINLFHRDNPANPSVPSRGAQRDVNKIGNHR